MFGYYTQYIITEPYLKVTILQYIMNSTTENTEYTEIFKIA